ncbi:MAG: serpin family protein [Candidatus Eremiobacteraeota bacterium]|nr:serpin family protein [Candidatus Eremiobacteraeota bacterium]
MDIRRSLRLKVVALTAASVLSTIPAAASLPLPARYNAFGFDIFSKLMAHDQGNVVVSPVSVALALSMAQNGAAAKTRTAIAHVLHVSDLSDEQLNGGAAALMQDLPAPTDDLQFSIANSLWVKNGFQVHAAFENEIQSSYQAKIANIPFNDSGLAQLNGWVKEHTLGLIPKILDHFNDVDSAVLANAVALKAKWLHPFDPHATSNAPFYAVTGRAHTISMMRQMTQLQYAKGKHWQLVRLPYRGDRFSMYVFLPAKDENVTLTSALFDQARSHLTPTLIEYQMPRFVVNYGAELNEPLSALGMGIAFDPNAANFSRMTQTAVHISKVVHKTYVRVDEEGTQAGAVTAIVISGTALIVPKDKMIVDHPFYMVLRDDKRGQILFLGRIAAPG